MSLLDGKKRQPDQIVIVERVRDYKNESMADSIMNDREGMRIASDITNAINRKKH